MRISKFLFTHAKVNSHQREQALSHVSRHFSLGLVLFPGHDPLDPLDAPGVLDDADKGALGSHVLVDPDVLAALEEAHLGEGAVAGHHRGRVELVGKLQDGAEPGDDVRRGRAEERPDPAAHSQGQPRKAEELKDDVELLRCDGVIEVIQMLHAVDGGSSPGRHEETAELVFGKTELVEQHEAVRVVGRLAPGIASAVLAVFLFAKDGAGGLFEELVLCKGGHPVYLSFKRGEGLVASYSHCQSVCMLWDEEAFHFLTCNEDLLPLHWPVAGTADGPDVDVRTAVVRHVGDWLGMVMWSSGYQHGGYNCGYEFRREQRISLRRRF